MAKRLSLQKKKEILDLFVVSNLSIDQLSNKFECTPATIIRNLKKELGNEKYQEIISSESSRKILKDSKKDIKLEENQNNDFTLNGDEQSC